MGEPKKEAIFLKKWKEAVSHIAEKKFGKLNPEKLNTLLNQVIEDNLENKKMILVNNYKNLENRTDLLQLIDIIEQTQCIIGGGAVLYAQHDKVRNIIIAYNLMLKSERNALKNKRKSYEKYSYEWLIADIGQGNKKTKMNSLYGVMGYKRFLLYNRFIAESITNCGRNIISTAVMAFENFLAGSVKFNTENEVYQYIDNICGEYNKKYKNGFNTTIFHFDDIDTQVLERLESLMGFAIVPEFEKNIKDILANLSLEEKILLYYKNNLFEFSRLPFIMDKLRYIIQHVSELKVPELDKVEDVQSRQLMEDVWDFYKVFVLYDFPMFDRVRKAAYTDKVAVLYVDTDSDFLALNRWVEFITNEVMQNEFVFDKKESIFVAVNTITIYLGNVIEAALRTFCKNMHVTDEYAKLLSMKNEFYLETIVFTPVKKRYISNAILQEGQLLGGGLGVPEIKGFDFKKATTKQFVREYYEKICYEDVLKEDIKVIEIYHKIQILKNDIRTSMRKGESKYFKQAEVKLFEYYKEPFSNMGSKAVIVWNTLCPEYAIDLPSDVDIIPIKDLSLNYQKKPEYQNCKVDYRIGKKKIYNDEKVIDMVKENHPDLFKLLEERFYNNPNPLLRYMKLNYIAKPKNENTELPSWFSDIVDTEKVERDTLGLIFPILESLGMNLQSPKSKVKHLTNIVAL